MTTTPRPTYHYTGHSEIGDEHGPIPIWRATVDGVTVTRRRKRGTATRQIWTVGDCYYTSERAALRAVRP